MIIRTTIEACHLFDNNNHLIKKVAIKEPVSAAKLLADEKWIEEEEALLKICRNKPVTYLGKKEEAPKKVTLSENRRNAPVYDYNFAVTRKALIKIAKHRISGSFTADVIIIQLSSSISDLQRALHLIVRRIREWFQYYLPEASYLMPDDERFLRTVSGKKPQAILRELKLRKEDSMASELSEEQEKLILEFVNEAVRISSLIAHYDKKMEQQMKKICPNLLAVAGPGVGAKLLEHAGSLRRLAQMPSSTLQVLGAEKALFRHLQNKRFLPPKYGVLHEHPLIAKAAKKGHGKIARALADKISIAVRIDYFKGKFLGKEIRAKLEKKFG